MGTTVTSYASVWYSMQVFVGRQVGFNFILRPHIREGNKISTPTYLKFSRSSYLIQLTGMLYDLTESGESKMPASKPEVPIYQPRQEHNF